MGSSSGPKESGLAENGEFVTQASSNIGNGVARSGVASKCDTWTVTTFRPSNIGQCVQGLSGTGFLPDNGGLCSPQHKRAGGLRGASAAIAALRQQAYGLRTTSTRTRFKIGRVTKLTVLTSSYASRWRLSSRFIGRYSPLFRSSDQRQEHGAHPSRDWEQEARCECHTCMRPARTFGASATSRQFQRERPSVCTCSRAQTPRHRRVDDGGDETRWAAHFLTPYLSGSAATALAYFEGSF